MILTVKTSFYTLGHAQAMPQALALHKMSECLSFTSVSGEHFLLLFSRDIRRRGRRNSDRNAQRNRERESRGLLLGC